MTNNISTAFISYSWDSEDHKEWVRDLAARLRSEGVAVKLDQWEVTPGDQLPQFMEVAIRNSKYVLIICTPRYKSRSDKREGGVGYEGDIMTADVMNTRNQRKFIPILREGIWADAAPSWLSGKLFVDLSGTTYSESHYQDLLTTILGTRMSVPPVMPRQNVNNVAKNTSVPRRMVKEEAFTPIRIAGIIIDEVGEPRNDGTPGSALYRVPFRLSHHPSREWADLFIAAWDLPARFTTMHRPGTASVVEDRVYLNRTTIEEVEKYHRETLLLAAKEANQKYQVLLDKRQAQEQARSDQAAAHRHHIEDVGKRISFDDEGPNA